MIGSSSTGRFVDVREHGSRQPYLTSPRAAAACARELARLNDDIVVGVTRLTEVADEEKPVVRRSPDRCIVQLGPVALTLAWLRGSHDSVADGELLIVVWRGAVAPRKQHLPERPSRGPAAVPAASLWEQVLTPVAESEETWTWQPAAADVSPCGSGDLAARCVERLRVAYLETVAAGVGGGQPG
jgi:hypothetical protein